MPEILSRLGVRLWLFPGCGEACGLCPGSGAWRARLGFWGLACWWASVALCLWFRLWTWSVIAIWGRFCGPGVVVGGSCGGCVSLLAWGWPFPGWAGRWGGLWAVSKVESSARAPRLPRFIQLVSFIDTLLVVWTLDIVYDCHLRPLLQS